MPLLPPVHRLKFGSVPSADGTADLRREVRAFLADQTFEPRVDCWLTGWSTEFSRALGKRGWLGMTWPKRYGGHEQGQLLRYAVIEELLAAGAPVAAHWIADRQTGPLLLRCGTEVQKQRFLPAIASGSTYFAIGMSEPDAGSDLAAVTTKASRVEGGWTIRGRKTWTSGAHRANYMIALVRTSGRNESKHDGLSQLIVDLHATGVEIRPIRLLSGEHHFNEVTFDDVFVPDAMLVGSEGDGWAQVTSELAYERSGPERFLSTLLLYRSVAAHSQGPLAEDLTGRLTAKLWSLRLLSQGVAAALELDQPVELEAALVKDFGTSFEREITDVTRRLFTSPRPALIERLLWEAIVAGPGFTLRGGTTEILRTVIARGLH